MRGELLVAVVDGQGGGMGRGLVEAVKKKWPSLHVRALGTNSLATAAMLRAGADDGATGENAVAFNARRADILLGPIGVLTPNGLLGEVSPRMAEAIGGQDGTAFGPAGDSSWPASAPRWGWGTSGCFHPGCPPTAGPPS